MYLYQLMLSKEWQQVQSSKSQNQHYSSVLKTKRIKHFYDNDYDGIVNYLVANPNSCKNFYATLQQVGLSYQSYYEKMPDHVATVLKATLFNEEVVLIELPPQGGYYEESLLRNPLLTSSVTNQDPVYESDDAWLIVDLLNHQPELIDIRDPAAINTTVTNAKTGPDQIFLKHSNSMSPHQVLPKVHILLGGKQGDYNLATRGEKSLRVKKLAQQWLDELSTLLQSGNSPFSIMQNNALASIVNHGFSAYQYPSINALVDHPDTNCNQSVAALFYQLLLLLDNTDFIIAKQRMGDLSANDSEGAIPDSKLLRQAINSVSNLRHSEGYHYAYTNNELAQVATEYLRQPLILAGTGQDNDVESKLQALIAHYTSNDNLTSIETLYFNGIKLLKRLREPGMIRHVVTRQEYKLNATKLQFSQIQLPSTKSVASPIESGENDKSILSSIGEVAGDVLAGIGNTIFPKAEADVIIPKPTPLFAIELTLRPSTIGAPVTISALDVLVAKGLSVTESESFWNSLTFEQKGLIRLAQVDPRGNDNFSETVLKTYEMYGGFNQLASESNSNSDSEVSSDTQTASGTASGGAMPPDDDNESKKDSLNNSDKKGVGGNGAASDLPSLNGKSPEDARKLLEKYGFDGKSTSSSGWQRFKGKDGSEVMINWQNGRIVRTAAPKYGQNGAVINKGQRLDANGNEILRNMLHDTHPTETIKLK